MATGREVAAAVTQRVEDEFRRTGLIAPELVRHIQASAWKRGSAVSTEDVERATREWIETRLQRLASRAKPDKHADDKVERAIDLLFTSSPTSDPHGWAQAVATVEHAWEAGELTRRQQRQLDDLNARYEAMGA